MKTENNKKESEVFFKDADHIYQYLRVNDILPALDAVDKRKVCEAIEKYKRSATPIEGEIKSKEVDRGVEKAEDYAAIRYPFVALEEKSLVADNAIIEACRNAFIAGAKWAANDVLSLIKFVRNLEYMNGTKPQHEFSEQEIYNLFKQKQL